MAFNMFRMRWGDAPTVGIPGSPILLRWLCPDLTNSESLGGGTRNWHESPHFPEILTMLTEDDY